MTTIHVLLPTTSIVFVFHNEAWTTLLKNVILSVTGRQKSLLKRLSWQMMHKHKHLGNQLEEYIHHLPLSIKILQTDERSGARLLGAKHVSGSVLNFKGTMQNVQMAGLNLLSMRWQLIEKTVYKLIQTTREHVKTLFKPHGFSNRKAEGLSFQMW